MWWYITCERDDIIEYWQKNGKSPNVSNIVNIESAINHLVCNAYDKIKQEIDKIWIKIVIKAL